IVGEDALGVNDALDPIVSYESEWNRVMYRLCVGPGGVSGEGIVYGILAKYSVVELGLVGDGGYNWCMEKNGIGVLGRGNGDVRGFQWGSPTVNDTTRGSSPVLELVE